MKYIQAGVFLITGVFFLALFSSNAKAEETTISVSGNGSDSQSQVTVSKDTLTSIQQLNTVEIQNNAQTNANTGGNQVSSNTGGTISVQTGSIESNTVIQNQDINSNVSDNKKCTSNCASNLDAQISGNGSVSQNQITGVAESTTTVSQINSAIITNNVLTIANTGDNSANNNEGDVHITTGDIHANTQIQNKNINLSVDPSGSSGFIHIAISGNGSNSTNTIFLAMTNSVLVSIGNFIVLNNNVVQDLNTGGSTANNNNGSVFIGTGTISSNISILNEGINTSFVALGPTAPSGKPPTGGVTPPSQQPGSVPQGQEAPSKREVQESSVGSGGEVLGAAVGGGASLPVTGGYLTFLATLLAIILFLIGGYLRFRSDISPPVALAIC